MLTPNEAKRAIDKRYRMDETECVTEILAAAALEPTLYRAVEAKARKLVEGVRQKRLSQSGIDAFMFQYDLSSEEGIALMCLAEALLRIPDKETVDSLIRDKLAQGNWQAHAGKSHSLFVNAATWALMLTGKIVDVPSKFTRQTHENSLTQALKRLASKGGEPIVRQAIHQAMKILGRQFVMGRTIKGALKRAKRKEEKGYRFSFDMLGEAAYTQADADKYFAAYQKAISAVGEASAGRGPIQGPGISVKLSALHPRYVIAKRERLHRELLPKLMELVAQAKAANIGLTIDAEEAHTLMISLDLIEAVIDSGVMGEWQGFGLAVQAYQKRAPAVLDWLVAKARSTNTRLMIRLVKGAYWDTEIKLAQVQGLSGYPVFTRKIATDVNYIVCAKKLFAASDCIYPQFATHNALSLAIVYELAKEQQVTEYEFQCLHGMGDALYEDIVSDKNDPKPCRVYAPVGTHEDLLAYLVRRLLENGANSSFVNRIIDEKLPIDEMVANPIEKLAVLSSKPHPGIPLPLDLYQPQRANSPGVDLNRESAYLPVLANIAERHGKTYQAKPTTMAPGNHRDTSERYSPIDRSQHLGTVTLASQHDIVETLSKASIAFADWQLTPAVVRASYLQKMAMLLEQHAEEFYSLLVFEAGKTLDDAVSELREAIDFCHYYAQQALLHFATPQTLIGPTGELNQLSLHGRGIIACISPWNFPLAIFLGQVTAALAAGNCVIAKPASQTVFIAARATALLHEAGFPVAAVQLLPGSGALIGNALVNHPHIAGIVFTGSTETARNINQQLAARLGPIVPFIAETGGQNVMIVDSSALCEQVTQDVLTSAFRSAGQRCSALRVLFVQEEISDKLLTMIQGAMAELTVGNPALLATDVGPVIDEAAQKQLLAHSLKLKDQAKLLFEVSVSDICQKGSFVAPRLFEIASLDKLTEEVFGPILHVVRYKRHELDEVIAQINRTGFGLTMGIHSRINEVIDYIRDGVRVGNLYVNRNMIGAVVGVQPFGGEGLSGTGPKAGGPHYLPRLATERTISINTTASGGNASLMSLSED